jgi:hypothetical protein
VASSYRKLTIEQFNHKINSAIHAATKGKETQDLIAVQASLQRAADKLSERIAKRTMEKLCRTTPAAPSTRR